MLQGIGWPSTWRSTQLQCHVVLVRREIETIANTDTSRIRRLALLFLAGMLVIHVGVWWSARKQLQAGYQDFTTFYAAGRILSSGDSSRLYDSALQRQVEQEFAPQPVSHKGLLPYLHPPIEAVIFLPLAKLPYFDAYLLWDAISVLAMAVALLILRQHLPRVRGEPAWLLILAGMAFFPVFTALLQGQDDILLFLFFALSYSAMKRNSDFAAGCWLGLATFRFQIVLPLILILVLRKAWRTLSGFTLVAGLMGLASIAVVGWQAALHYPSYVMQTSRIAVGPIVPELMPNLRGLVDVVSGHPDSYPVSIGITVLLSAGLLWVVSKRWKTSLPDLVDLSWSLGIIAALLASYYTYLYDLSLLLIPVLLISNYRRSESENDVAWLALGPMLVLFVAPFIVLCFRYKMAFLITLLLLVSFWGLVRESSNAPTRQPADG
jgi:glycosyl transferase family 87